MRLVTDAKQYEEAKKKTWKQILETSVIKRNENRSNTTPGRIDIFHYRKERRTKGRKGQKTKGKART